MSKLSLKIITTILILSAIGLGLWLVNKNFPATGQLEIKAILGQDQPMISSLGPEPRVKLENDYQIILDSPVYFDLRSSRWFKIARVELVYQEIDRQLINIAGKTGPDWQYDEKEPTVILDLNNGYKKAVFDFSLDNLYRPKNISRFLISTQGEIRSELKIKSIKVILSR